MVASAQLKGIPAVFVTRYIELQSGWLGPLIRASGPFRDRMLADPSFLFKVGAEVVIDSGCATFAEVNKRGKDFWKEFDLYTSDLLVGISMDIALVGMLAPAARFGAGALVAAPTSGLRGKMMSALQSLPNSIFEGAMPGQSFSPPQRAATWIVKGVQYGVVGFGCGLVGQSLASGLIHLKRRLRKVEEGEHAEEDIAIPGIVPTAGLWCLFMAVSSNTRYQIINGLERVVETSAIARRVPLAASAFTVGIRFGNNVYGGMQFVDWARWLKVQ
eukprot:TRINITY_DN15055_c0_g1_i1.p1 TRINITY_DN15055_c0_g1~~TRINITY_DN15055_c0_g1_i1.p1  ORF type:complete len:307 (-),score=57.99 TRINITY_DN15055_c0_g1_i1:1026-1844(-)